MMYFVFFESLWCPSFVFHYIQKLIWQLCKNFEWTCNKYFQSIEANFFRFVITFTVYVELAKNAVWIASQADKRYYLLERNIIFMVLSSCQICKMMSNYADLLLFNLCSLYKCCISYICCIAAKFAGHVNNIPKNLYTEFCLFICFPLISGMLPSWNNRNNLF